MVEGVSGLPADEIMRLVANAWDNGADRSVKDSLHGDGETIATPPDQGDFQTYQNAMPVLPPEYTDIAEEGVRGGPYADLRIPRRRDYAPTVLGEPASGAENRASISGAGSQIGASVSVSGASQSVPAAADTGLVFQPGDRVHYWSETHNQWMEATVKSLNYDREGRPHTYDLNVKRGAQASRIRRWSAALEEQLEAMAMARDADSAMNGIQATDMNPPDAGALGYSVAAGNGASELADGPTSGVSVCVSGAPDPPEGDAGTGGSGVGDCDATLSSFAPGDKVEYWSDTYSQWMQAVVKRIRENGSTYDLDVKKGAHRRKMRRIPTGASVVTLPQAAAGYEAPANFPHARSNESSPNQMLHKALFEQALPVAAPAAEPGLGATPPSLSLACASSCGGCTSCAGASAAVPASNAASHTRRPSPFSGQQVQRNGATSAVRGTSVPEIPAPGQQQENSSPFRVSIGGSAPRAAASLQAVGARQKKRRPAAHLRPERCASRQPRKWQPRGCWRHAGGAQGQLQFFHVAERCPPGYQRSRCGHAHRSDAHRRGSGVSGECGCCFDGGHRWNQPCARWIPSHERKRHPTGRLHGAGHQGYHDHHFQRGNSPEGCWRHHPHRGEGRREADRAGCGRHVGLEARWGLVLHAGDGAKPPYAGQQRLSSTQRSNERGFHRWAPRVRRNDNFDRFADERCPFGRGCSSGSRPITVERLVGGAAHRRRGFQSHAAFDPAAAGGQARPRCKHFRRGNDGLPRRPQ